MYSIYFFFTMDGSTTNLRFTTMSSYILLFLLKYNDPLHHPMLSHLDTLNQKNNNDNEY